MKKIFAAVVILLSFTGGLKAQDWLEYQQYSGALSTLYRGRLPAQYSYRYNGTYYWDNLGFRKGDLFYNGKLYHDILMNIDACRMDLQVRTSQELTPVVPNPSQVGWFTIDGRFFINLRNLGYNKAPDGYLELVKDGSSPVLRQVRKVLRNSATNNNGEAIGYIQPDYDANVVSYFAHLEYYYTLQGNEVKKMTKNAYKKALKDISHSGTPFLENLARIWKGTTEAAPLPEEKTNIKSENLPEDYFSENPQSAGTSTESGGVKATYRNKIYILGNGKGPGPFTIRGQVRDMESGEPFPEAVVFDEKTSTYTRTDNNGYYSITLPAGENTLHYSDPSKEEISLRIRLDGNSSLDVELPEKVTLLKASVVSANSMENHRRTTMGVQSVSISTLNKIPTAFGEADVLKGVFTLPGVKSAGEASTGFTVRGGAQDENLILFNGNTIYNPTHLFGLFSTFNPDVVEEVELLKSSIPAHYGGRISSVLDVQSREGSLEKFKASLGIGLLTGHLHLEGPIVKNKTSFLIAGRTTYSDWLLGLIPKSSHYSGGSAGFADVNANVTHHFDSENSLQLNAYYAHDRFGFGADTLFTYSNIDASLRFRHRGKNGFSWQASAGYDQFGNNSRFSGWEAGAYSLETYIREVFLRTLFQYSAGNHFLEWGLDAVGYAIDPGHMSPFGEYSTILSKTLAREYAVEPALHVSDNWHISDKFSIEGGIRLSSFLRIKPDSFHIGPEFRLSARYSPLSNLSVKAGINTMRQYIHLISNTSAISPMDTWKLTTSNLLPTTGYQAAAGIYWTELGTGLDFSVETYWKQSRNILDYKAGATLNMNENLENELVPVIGRAYGVELMVKKSTGKLTGWVSYSYSRSQLREMQDRGNETIAHGNWYNAPMDKPHEFKLTANWAITHRFSLSANIDYASGRPVTVPVGKYYFGNSYHLAYSERNAARIPDYFRMDAAFNIDPGHKLKSFIHYTFTVGVYNITGRKNPYSVFFRSDSQGNVHGYMLSVFASQIPYASINLLF